MHKCGDCIRYEECEKYVTKDETFPETNGCTAFVSRTDKKLEKAIIMLTKVYAWAKKQDWVHNPLAYALYRTWREADKGKGKSA